MGMTMTALRMDGTARNTPSSAPISQKYKANVHGVAATVWLEGDRERIQVRYPRYTKLGERLLKNHGSEREILANYIRQELVLPRGEDATRF